MSDFGTLESRVRRKSLLKKVVKAEDTIEHFKPGMNLLWSGFTPAGYPKEVPIALADHVEKNNLQGKLKFNLFIGASVGAETEDRWATLDMIDRRWPYQTGKNIAKGINEGRIRMGDKHLGLFAQARSNAIHGNVFSQHSGTNKSAASRGRTKPRFVTQRRQDALSDYRQAYRHR